MVDMQVRKSISQLLEEWGDPFFTRADFEREKAALILLFKRHYDLDGEEQIEEAIRTHKLPCENKFVECWIELHEIENYL